MYEAQHQRLLPRKEFFRRLANNVAWGISIITASLLIGILGYHFVEDQPFVDAFLNAAMILSGMGPAAQLHTDAGKIFAGLYALFSGTIVLVVMAVILAPLIHRFLHKFHMQEK